MPFSLVACSDASVMQNKIGIGISTLDIGLSARLNIADPAPGGTSNKIEFLGIMMAVVLVPNSTMLFNDNSGVINNFDKYVDCSIGRIWALGKLAQERIARDEVRLQWRRRRSVPCSEHADSLARRAWMNWNIVSALYREFNIVLPTEEDIRVFTKEYTWA